MDTKHQYLPSDDYIIEHSADTILWQAGEVLDEYGNFTPDTYSSLFGDSTPTDTSLQILEDFGNLVDRVPTEDLEAYLASHSWDSFIHDYWLTRNRHGAGFWDRGLGELGDRLTDLAHQDGEYSVFGLGDGSGWSYE